MKKCRRCQKPATLHITEVRKGDVTELHLCESCAREYLDQPEADTEQTAEYEFEKLADGDESESSPADERNCTHCAISFREFRSQGRLGCAYCYTEFEADLLPLLENIHGEVQHCGKLPRRAPDSSRRQHELMRLKNELKSAIDDEDYEQAATLRDEIQTIESQIEPSAESMDSE